LQDGRQRVFQFTADQVAAEVPAYGEYVKKQIAKLGRNHPLIRTQYFCEEIDAESGMFPAARRILMRGNHAYIHDPAMRIVDHQLLNTNPVAFLIDVAGIDEAKREAGGEALENPSRDSTTLTVVEIDFSSCDDPLIHAPTYRVINRQAWQGERHSKLYAQLKALAEAWQPEYWIIDSTGVGAGLADFITNIGIGTVIPFLFTSSSKSKLGWDFLGIVETGRFKDSRPLAFTPYQQEWEEQLEACQMIVIPGPGQLIRWSVPDGTRNPRDGTPLHDDWIMSAALVAILDQQELMIHQPAVFITAADPLEAIDKEGF
jgi:Terminase RNaseH-like domain